MKTEWLFFSVISLAGLASASPTTLGCVSPDIVSLLLASLIGGTFNNIATPAICVARCVTANRQFAYWSASNTRCHCSNTGPNINQLTSTAVPVGLASATNLCPTNEFHVQTLGLPYDLQSCATPSSITGVYAPPSAPTTINQCLTACQALYSFALVTLGTGSTCTCAKGVTVAPAGLGRCMAGNTAVYRNTGVIDPGPSGMKKKKRKLEEDKRLCPGSMAACLIAGHGDAHECVDTDTELESCGGCVAGAVDSILDRRKGVDCSRIPGVAMGGVSCTEGRCIITHCKPGWSLAPDRCFRRL